MDERALEPQRTQVAHAPQRASPRGARALIAGRKTERGCAWAGG